MNCQADHLNFRLELNLTTNGITIFEPLDCYYGTISETPFKNISKATFPNQIFVAEIVCRNLKFSELKSLKVTKANFFTMLV